MNLAAVCALLFFAQDFSQVTVQTIARGYAYTEGPAWSPDGYLVFSDTPSDRLMKWIPGRQPELLRAGANGPAGNAFDSEGRLYTCETRARRVTRMGKNGKIEVLAETWEGKRLNAPNDIAVGRNGHAYFTDPAFGTQSDTRELDFYGVYHIPPRGPMRLVARPAGRPNGIALSPDGRILYVGNSDEHNVRAYDLDRNGDASNERVLISGIPAVPGGIRVDGKGNLYIAAGGVLIYSPDGRLLHTIEMKERPSNLAFGEAGMKTLFVTARDLVFRMLTPIQAAPKGAPPVPLSGTGIRACVGFPEMALADE
jgi:gluconolactonase